MSDKLQKKIKIHQKWGFGMAPPKKHTVVSRRKAVQSVLMALNGGKSLIFGVRVKILNSKLMLLTSDCIFTLTPNI